MKGCHGLRREGNRRDLEEERRLRMAELMDVDLSLGPAETQR